MKKLFAVVMTIVMLFGCVSLTAFAEEQPLTAKVYVTIANKGELVISGEKITVTDRDNSGTFTLDEALYAAHEAKYTGGAEAGYNSYVHDKYGLSLGKLWGDNSGNFGYYVNNASASNLADTVTEGDYVNAFVYSDGEYFSDTYCWFDTTAVSADTNEEITLKLSCVTGYDAENNYAPIIGAVEGATITVNGEKTEYKTDDEGKATVKIATGGSYVISAVSDTQTLVPPVCKAIVASDDTAKVYVTIANKGKLALTQEEVTVSDTDKDGYLTIGDALYAAHEAKYDGGAENGYNSYVHDDYGLSLGKLWGDNSGNFGYYVNNASAWSLADVVKEGDYVNAFVYSDGEYYSDTYCWFDVNTVTTQAGKEISLTLSGAGYDADWNPITVAIEGATITLNGEKTEIKTDKDGKATITVSAEGSYVISAVSDAQVLVPPVCKASVSKAEVITNNNDDTNDDVTSPKTGDESNIIFFAFFMVVSAGALITLSVMRKKSYEK